MLCLFFTKKKKGLVWTGQKLLVLPRHWCCPGGLTLKPSFTPLNFPACEKNRPGCWAPRKPGWTRRGPSGGSLQEAQTCLPAPTPASPGQEASSSSFLSLSLSERKPLRAGTPSLSHCAEPLRPDGCPRVFPRWRKGGWAGEGPLSEFPLQASVRLSVKRTDCARPPSSLGPGGCLLACRPLLSPGMCHLHMWVAGGVCARVGRAAAGAYLVRNTEGDRPLSLGFPVDCRGGPTLAHKASRAATQRGSGPVVVVGGRGETYTCRPAEQRREEPWGPGQAALRGAG